MTLSVDSLVDTLPEILMAVGAYLVGLHRAQTTRDRSQFGSHQAERAQLFRHYNSLIVLGRQSLESSHNEMSQMRMQLSDARREIADLRNALQEERLSCQEAMETLRNEVNELRNK